VIQLAVECLRFGTLGVRSAPHGAFEIILFAAGDTATTAALIEVERSGHPSLKISKVDPQERALNPWATASVEKAVIDHGRDENPTDFKLTAARKGDAVEIVLAGHCGYRLFWWRAEIELVNNEVIVRGPFLSNDPDS
jgi:hypothetical protein